MSVDLALLVATAVLAVVALVAAIVAVRALRETRRLTRGHDEASEPSATPTASGADLAVPEVVEPPRLHTLPGRVVEGRVIVSPTSEQLAAASLGRPSARGESLARGIVHALRPESRDRITALIRRSYRQRRRARLRAGRRAARSTVPTPPSELWLGEAAPVLEIAAGQAEGRAS